MPERFIVAVTFDAERGYIGSAPELRQPVTALSLAVLRKRIEERLIGEDVEVRLMLDRAARLERDRRRLTGRPRRSFAGTPP
jgi:hypothetical protein